LLVAIRTPFILWGRRDKSW